MAAIEHWRLCDELTVEQAALLMLNIAPDSKDSWHLTRDFREGRPDGYLAYYTALTNAVEAKTIKAKIVLGEERRKTLDMDGCEAYETFQTGKPDWDQSKILVSSLKDWLRTRGVRTGFFFPQATNDIPDYLNPDHPHYAPKLAAAVGAWEAVNADESLLRNKSPKQAITAWLNEQGKRYGLFDDVDKPIEDGIEQVAKVANWKPSGGAPKTQGNTIK